MSCQPMELQYGSAVKTSLEEQLKASSSQTDSNMESISTRSTQKEFKNHFVSNKLDLVFVLDTGPGMKAFYQNNPFGSVFLSQLQNYDWKTAYTDMSIDIQKIVNQKEEEKKETKEKQSCNFLAGLTMTAGGILLGQGSPLLAGFGLKELGNCFSFEDSDSEKKIDYANGAFLPFEYNGEKIITQPANQLSADVFNYNDIFDHSLRLNNPKIKDSYSAPILRQTESYPFLSFVFSIARALNNPLSPGEDKKNASFFRKDSLIVYVLITIQDMKITISPEKFSESIESVFENKQRFKLIPITLTENSQLFCNLKLQKTSTESVKLRQLAKNLNYPSLDICSNQLGQKLFNEISKNLYSKNLLNN